MKKIIKPSYELLSRIDDKSKLATLFNEILHRLNSTRILSAPTSFSGIERRKLSEEAFYNTCLWEVYLHGVVNRLNDWSDTIDEYINEFNSDWRYYAHFRRMDYIKRFGGKESDYNADGSIKTDVNDEELSSYSIICDLTLDDWRDIVQETQPTDLVGLGTALQVNAKMSITDIFASMGHNVPAYRRDENGNMVEMSWAERELNKISDASSSDNLYFYLICVCGSIQALLNDFRIAGKKNDNKELFIRLHNDVRAVLDLNVKSGIFKEFHYALIKGLNDLDAAES
ncbi:MAG: hypothetical protein LBS88_07290 [Tannerellaceae bacterium]|jgi:hypothetical protein|nr:hypothetical protein [Tannerellaceae bacterium]